MEALLRAKGLWKCTQVLAQDFMTTLEPLTLKEKAGIETKFDKALGTIQCFLDQGSVGRARILYQDLFNDPSLHNQAKRRIS